VVCVCGRLELMTLKWMDNHETTAKYNIAETCAASISINDLLDLAEKQTEVSLASTSMKLTYGTIRGSDALRANLAGLYSARTLSPMSKDHILVTPGAIAANFLVLYALISPGDHVICHYPTYEQLYNVPASLGADVSLWKADPSKRWQLDVEELKAMIKASTKMIILNNPNNPTGTIIPKSTLEDIISLAREKGLIILSDEVYRPMFHSIGPMDEDFPPSAINMGYDKVVVTGSLSKAYSLAGIRTGWIACKNKAIIETCAGARHYTTISVSLLDQAVAAEALSENCVHALLSRNIRLAQKNLAILDTFIEEHRWACSWVKPLAGTTAFVKFTKMGKAVDDEVFCETLQQKTGVLFCPGSKCFGGSTDWKGFIRIGFCCETAVLEQGLTALRTFMEEDFEALPTVQKVYVVR
jgi:aspartate/methionine/tyrosine aminotransferase